MVCWVVLAKSFVWAVLFRAILVHISFQVRTMQHISFYLLLHPMLLIPCVVLVFTFQASQYTVWKIQIQLGYIEGIALNEATCGLSTIPSPSTVS